LTPAHSDTAGAVPRPAPPDRPATPAGCRS
jgi:hypothetical protein